jgi:isopentenyldiphosphate isomerase
MSKNHEEWFDVVNERDEVVGRKLRREVHAHGWLHRAVHVLVFNRAGQVFLQKRSMRKDMSPGLWDSSCSGHLDAGEDYDTAVVRELREELGLLAELGGGNRGVGAPRLQLERRLRVEACAETGQEFVWVYRVEAEGPFTLCPDEIDGGEWIAPDELNRRIAAGPDDYCPAFRLIWALASNKF